MRPGQARLPAPVRWVVGRAVPPDRRTEILEDLDELVRRCDEEPGLRSAAWGMWREVGSVFAWGVVHRTTRLMRLLSSLLSWEDVTMDGWIHGVRLAVRSLLRQPGFSAVAIITLALGIGANTAIFSLIDGALLRPLPYADPDGLVYLSDGHDDIGGTGIDQSIPNLMDLRSGSRLLESSAIIDVGSGNLATEERPERARILRVSSEFLHVLGVSPRVGRDMGPENDVAGSTPVAILTDELWRSRFGSDPDIVGRTTTVDAVPVEILGVLPAGFSFPSAPDLIMPLQHVGGEFGRGSRSYNAVGRLADGATLPALREELQGIFAGLVEQFPEANGGWYTWADPIRDYAIGPQGQSLYLFGGAVGLVLLIACANVANLLIVRVEGRSREFAVRYSLGASRSALLPLFLGEGLVLSLLGGVAGILTAYLSMDGLLALYGNAIPRADQIHLSGAALAFGTGVSIAVGIAVGLLPVLRTHPEQTVEHLKDAARGSSGRGSRLGSALVVGEVALAVLVVTGAGLLTKSVARLQGVDLGVEDPDRVLTFRVSLPTARYADDATVTSFYDDLLADLQRMPGVQSAAAVNRLPLLGGDNVTNFPSAEDPDRNARFVSIRGISPAYFETTGVPLVAGRWLSEEEFAEPGVSILANQTLANQLFPGEDAVGRRVAPGWTDDGAGLRIVGVVGDIGGGNPTRPPPPAVYMPARWFPQAQQSVMVKSRGADPYDLLLDIRRSVARLDPEVPIYSIRTLEEIADARLGTRRVAMLLFATFAGLALLLGAVGIYGVMSYSVAQRAQELGVRLALGASRGSVFGLVFREGARLTLPGVALGLVLALASARVLRGLLYQVGTLDPATYVGVALILLGVAAGASYVPARRATRVDPVGSMRAG